MNDQIFRHGRVFYHTNTLDSARSGWYFEIRGGKTYGPFQNKEKAEAVLKSLIKVYRERHDDSGRDEPASD